jgi:ABC-type cobalamin transport system ATPase subunit
VYKYRKAILYLVERHATTIVVGETGSGKSTQIPQVPSLRCNSGEISFASRCQSIGIWSSSWCAWSSTSFLLQALNPVYSRRYVNYLECFEVTRSKTA